MGGGEPRQHTEKRTMTEKIETPESASAPPTGSASRERDPSLTDSQKPSGDPPPIPTTEDANIFWVPKSRRNGAMYWVMLETTKAHAEKRVEEEAWNPGIWEVVPVKLVEQPESE